MPIVVVFAVPPFGGGGNKGGGGHCGGEARRHERCRESGAAAGPRIDVQECDGSEFASMSLAFRLSGSERDWLVDNQSEN